jgi:hypothetical protein
MTFLSFSLAFGLLAVLHVSWIQNSNFMFLLSMYSSRGRLRIQVISSLVWLWWVIDLPRFEFESEKLQWFYPYLSCVESLLVSWCAGDSCDMAGSDEDHGRSRRPSVEDQGWSRTVEYSMAGWSRGRVTLCAVYTMHKETRSAGFLVWP